MGYGTQLQQAKDTITATTASDRELLAASGTLRHRVAYVFISANTAVTVTLKSSTTNLRWEMHVPEDGGVSATPPEGQFLFETAAGESLTWSSTPSASVFVSVLYTSR